MTLWTLILTIWQHGYCGGSIAVASGFRTKEACISAAEAWKRSGGDAAMCVEVQK